MQIGLRLLKKTEDGISYREIYPDIIDIKVCTDEIVQYGAETATILGLLNTIFEHLKDKTEHVNILQDTFKEWGISSQKFYHCINEYINSIPEDWCKIEKVVIDGRKYFKLKQRGNK